MVGWLCQSWGTPDIALFGSHSSRLRIENRFFFLIPYSFRNFLTKFGIFYQPDRPVGKQFNRFSTIVGWLCQSWGIPDLVLFGSHSSRLGIENRFFFLLPYSVRNFLAKFGIFYQPSEPVGNPFNPFQHHYWLPFSAMRNPWPFFVWFSYIRVRNWETFLFFASLFN